MDFFKRNRKISFEKEDLVLCKIALVTDYKILEYGDENTWWDYCSETLWITFPKTRILIRTNSDCYYEPDDYFNIFERRKYQMGHRYLKVGERFVKETNNIPIQYLKTIILTKKELKTKKISLKRIKELENLLNSK